MVMDCNGLVAGSNEMKPEYFTSYWVKNSVDKLRKMILTEGTDEF